MSRRYCLTLDLKSEPDLIRKYEEHHKKVWPEIIASIKHSGIEQMEICRFENRLFMVIEVSDDFSFERKAELDKNNSKVQQWEQLMWEYQQPLSQTGQGEKWVLLNKIFDLNEHTHNG